MSQEVNYFPTIVWKNKAEENANLSAAQEIQGQPAGIS